MAAEASERAERSVPGTVTVTFTVPDCARVALRGEWDISTEPPLAEALQRARRRPDVVIDLSECTFMDSRTIGILMSQAQEHTRRSGRLAIALPSTQRIVNRAFDLLGVREVLATYLSFEDAQRSLAVARASTANAWLEPSRPMPVD
jgi:anti-anti-sigma factor